MSTKLNPPPVQSPVTDSSGFFTPTWLAWLRDLFTRVGQSNAPSNNEVALNPMSTLGDTVYGGVGGAETRLPGNTSVTKEFLTQTGTGSASSSPAWGAIAASDVPTLNQNTTGNAATATTATTATSATTAGNITGVAAIANGGTGQTTQQAAIDALTGTQSAGKYLRSDGTHSTLSAIQAADVPTLNQNTTGTSANVTGTVAIANGGTGQTTQQAALDALSGTQSAGKYLRSDGTHTALASIVAADVPTLNQNTTGTAASVTGTNVIANSNLAQMAANTLKGNNTGATANASDLTQAQATALLNLFTSSLKGLVPASGGGTTNFLRADGTFAAPPAANLTAPTLQKFVAVTGTFTGNTTSGSATVSTVSSFTDLVVGMGVTGSGIPANTYITALNSGASTLTLSANATATATGVTITKQNSGTYTKPAGVLYLKIRMVGGGGGGESINSGSGFSGGAGGNTTFGTSLLVANGGGGGQSSNFPGAGGTASIASPALGLAVAGSGGCPSGLSGANSSGGAGGTSAFGGAGQGGLGNTATNGTAGAANSGSGGGGAGQSGAVGLAGGGAGGYVDALIPSPSSTYSFAVGAGGSVGGTGPFGGNGGGGAIIVEEHYQ